MRILDEDFTVGFVNPKDLMKGGNTFTLIPYKGPYSKGIRVGEYNPNVNTSAVPQTFEGLFPYIKVDPDEYKKTTGKTWFNRGEEVFTVMESTQYEIQERRTRKKTVSAFQPMTYDLRSRYHYGPNFDPSWDVATAYSEAIYAIPPMPSRLWYRTPYVAQLEVFLSTLKITTKYEWEEKESTHFGDFFRIVFVPIASAVFAGSSGGGAAAFISMAGSIMSLAAEDSEGPNAKYWKIGGNLLSMYGGMSGFLSGATKLGANMATTLLALQAASTAVSITSTFNQDKKNREARDLAADIEDLKALAEAEKAKAESADSTLNLEEFNIDINNESMQELLTLFSIAEFQENAMATGELFRASEFLEQDSYNRFK